MSSSDEPRRVHFQSPEYLVERLDAMADLFDTDRTDLLVEAIRAYLDETADDESVRNAVARKYYDDQLEFETVKQLVGAEEAQRLRLLKADLAEEPFDLASPADVDVYDDGGAEYDNGVAEYDGADEDDEGADGGEDGADEDDEGADGGEDGADGDEEGADGGEDGADEGEDGADGGGEGADGGDDGSDERHDVAGDR